jgi:fimbrial chaperone protein
MVMGVLASIALLPLSLAASASLPLDTLTISPVSLSLAYGQTSTSVAVQNAHPEPVSVQARIYRWTQDGDTDVLTPASDVVLSPPMATIPSQAVQTLRLLKRTGSAAQGNEELHYRMLLDEIPGVAGRPGQLSFAMRASIPMIVTPQKPSIAKLEWRASRGEDDDVLLTVTNSGQVYDRVLTLTATLPNGVIVNAVPRGTNPYVLPGAQRHWAIPAKVSASSLQINITTRMGRSERTLLIGP